MTFKSIQLGNINIIVLSNCKICMRQSRAQFLYCCVHICSFFSQTLLSLKGVDHNYSNYDNSTTLYILMTNYVMHIGTELTAYKVMG